MKVTFVIQDLFSQGAQYATALMARGFIAKNYEVDLVLSRVHADILAENDRRPFPVPKEARIIVLHDRKARNNIAELRRYLRTTDSVAIVSMCEPYTIALALASLGLTHRPRLYTVEHGATFAFFDDGTPRPVLRPWHVSWWVQRLINIAFDGYFAVSSGVAHEMTRVLHMRREKISVVFNPVVDHLFLQKVRRTATHPWLRNKSCPTFVAAGAYQPYKQHFVLMRAMKEALKKRNLRLIIFGRGPLENEYLKFIGENRLADNVSIAGYNDCLPAEVAASDGFVCSTNIESFGIAIVEALAAGVPVVSTDAPCGPAEILQYGRYGELVRVGDVSKMADALIRMADAGRISQPAESWEMYTLDKITERYARAMGLSGLQVGCLRPINRGGYQFFREWLCERWEFWGGCVYDDLKLPWKLKMLIGKLGLCFVLSRVFRSKKRLVVCVGGRIDYYAWPWCYRYEVIPVIWDCWPKYWAQLVKDVKRLKIKTAFCTSSQTAAHLREHCPGVNAVWLPEGIKSELYPMGPKLVDRKTDIMKFGRNVGGQILYPTQEEFTAAMRNAKIVISYPRCDTHPEQAGNIETLTQRYWECMLSGSLMVGRAPKELVDLCGYNPVVDAPYGQHEAVCQRILAHIGDYQELVNRNRAFAEHHADWSYRIPIINRELMK